MTDLNVLLRQVASRDRDAFAALYQQTSAKLYGIVLRIVRRREVADEVLQDVYIKVWDSAGRFVPDKGSAIAWMATVARNRALDEVRAGRHLVASDDAAVAEIADESRSQLDMLEVSEDLGRLKTCLEALEPDRRVLVMGAYLDGASREELAARTGHPIGTIKTWLHRSLKQLKDCLLS